MQRTQVRKLFLQNGDIRLLLPGAADFNFLQADFAGLLI